MIIKYDLIPFYSLLVDNFEVKVAVTKFPESASSKSEGVDISQI
jgi:hypothetical protein